MTIAELTRRIKSRTKKPPVPLECEIQRNGIKLLKALGWQVYRRNTASFTATYKGKERFVRANTAGMADTWGVMPDGRRFECEFKRKGKRPTPKQLAWLKDQNNAHCAAFWVDNTETLHNIAVALMSGSRIWWHEFGDDYDVDF